MVCSRLFVFRCIVSSLDNISFNCWLLIYPSLLANINCVSASNAEPSAISRKRQKSAFELREAPSAMFDGIDTEARCS